MKIAVIGFGYIGSIISAALCEMGNTVYAIEQDLTVINNLKKKIFNISEPHLEKLIFKSIDAKKLTINNSYNSVSSSDAVIITVGTPLSQKFDPDLSHLDKVFLKLSSKIKNDQMIIIKSTIPPGITRKLSYKYFGINTKVSIAFSPERLAEGNALKELNELPIIVGGINEKSTKACSEFWKRALLSKVIPVSSSEVAELVKLADNQWIDLNIALANELAMLSDSLDMGVDILEVINAANTLKKGSNFVNILTPSIGVGGYCLTKDPWFIDSIAKKNNLTLKLPATARYANDIMPIYVFNKIKDFLEKQHKFFFNKKISVLGYSFKSNSGDTRFTPMKVFIDELIKSGFKNISIYDSTVKDDKYYSENVTWEKNIISCIKGADALVFGAAHDDIKNLSLEDISYSINSKGMIYDGRRYFSYDEIKFFKSKGIHYMGVGRTI